LLARLSLQSCKDLICLLAPVQWRQRPDDHCIV
jgi:hypothetical protein